MWIKHMHKYRKYKTFLNNQLKNNDERIYQYIKGIKQFVDLNNNKNIQFDILLTDNTLPESQKITSKITDIFFNINNYTTVHIINCLNNNYGSINKELLIRICVHYVFSDPNFLNIK